MKTTEAQGCAQASGSSRPLALPRAGGLPARPQIVREARKANDWQGQRMISTMTKFSNELQRKWKYLKTQEGFQQAPLLTAFRLICWRARCLLHWPTTIRLPEWNMRMFLPAEWRGIGKLIFAFRENYEPELAYLKKILSPGKTFIDVGACYGIYTLAASSMVGEAGRVIAFEPASRAFPVLSRNITLNHLGNIHLFSLALSEERGMARLYHHPNVGCDSLGRDDSFTEEFEEIRTETLDNVLRQVPVDRVDLIKMDVQGAEEQVLRGARNLLVWARPIIIIESWPDGPPLFNLSPNGAWELLHGMGYELFVFEDGGSLVSVQSPPVDRNIVAIHRQQL
jgi:FkbM family methyltransferase